MIVLAYLMVLAGGAGFVQGWRLIGQGTAAYYWRARARIAEAKTPRRAANGRWERRA